MPLNKETKASQKLIWASSMESSRKSMIIIGIFPLTESPELKQNFMYICCECFNHTAFKCFFVSVTKKLTEFKDEMKIWQRFTSGNWRSQTRGKRIMPLTLSLVFQPCSVPVSSQEDEELAAHPNNGWYRLVSARIYVVLSLRKLLNHWPSSKIPISCMFLFPAQTSRFSVIDPF